ncbi:hypothetical protein CRG98_020294 [Punica granatum]|uniref:Cation-transporting P-type ATPase C-terminal domain-containing protein n=1 Tax=Punica granatum TaxID=22663 RepID=A0A2I0JSQ8_PUNGR|nr:hypothetical protein CRG98_020294 [Punica granatum]
MELAALVAIALTNGGGKPPDWQDFVGIIMLLLINSTISFIEENNAGNAAAALMAGLARKEKETCNLRVLITRSLLSQDACRSLHEAAILVPGDVISIKSEILSQQMLGFWREILSRSMNLFSQENRSKIRGDPVLSGSPCKQGEIDVVAVAAGAQTPYAETVGLVDSTENTNCHAYRIGSDDSQSGPTTFPSTVFAKDVGDADTIILLAGRAARVDNQDSIDACIVGMLGDPKEIIELCKLRADVKKRIHAIINRFAERGLRSLAIATQVTKHDCAETIRRALNLGVNVKMINQLAIGKETARRLGMGNNLYPSSSLFGQHRDESASLLIEKADGFAAVFPDIGIAVADATDAAQEASDIVLMELGLSVIISAVLTSRAIFQRMKNYTIYAVSITIRIVLGFLILALVWKYCFSPFMVLVISILNDGTIMTISNVRVKPSPGPDSWKIGEIFAAGVILGTYLAIMTILFYQLLLGYIWGEIHRRKPDELTTAVYLQVGIVSQVLIFVTRSRRRSYVERPGLLLVAAFLAAQLIQGMGWGWAEVIWLYSIITYIPLDFLKFFISYALNGWAWNNLLQNNIPFTTRKDNSRCEREAQCAQGERSVQLVSQGTETSQPLDEGSHSYQDLSEVAEQARKRVEIARLRELRTLKVHMELVFKLKGLDLDNIQQNYTL